jgi:hypothetical protein
MVSKSSALEEASQKVRSGFRTGTSDGSRATRPGAGEPVEPMRPGSEQAQSARCEGALPAAPGSSLLSTLTGRME